MVRRGYGFLPVGEVVTKECRGENACMDGGRFCVSNYSG